MKYYKISVSTEIKEIGKYPQVDDLRGGGRVYQKANTQNFAIISKWNNKTVLPDFSLFILNRKAKITDFLSSSFNMTKNALILSDKAIKVFREFKIPNIKKWPCIVYDTNYKKLNYTFLWHNNGENFIDFKHSKFNKFHRIYKKFEGVVEINSMNQYRKEDRILMNEPSGFYELYPKKIKLIKDFDLISFAGITAGAICSEKLKNAIERAELTGFDFREINYTIEVS